MDPVEIGSLEVNQLPRLVGFGKAKYHEGSVTRLPNDPITIGLIDFMKLRSSELGIVANCHLAEVRHKASTELSRRWWMLTPGLNSSFLVGAPSADKPVSGFRVLLRHFLTPNV